MRSLNSTSPSYACTLACLPSCCVACKECLHPSLASSAPLLLLLLRCGAEQGATHPPTVFSKEQSRAGTPPPTAYGLRPTVGCYAPSYGFFKGAEQACANAGLRCGAARKRRMEPVAERFSSGSIPFLASYATLRYAGGGANAGGANAAKRLSCAF
jgi:hypothetical protein